jgi:hypothetical protein
MVKPIDGHLREDYRLQPVVIHRRFASGIEETGEIIGM